MSTPVKRATIGIDAEDDDIVARGGEVELLDDDVDSSVTVAHLYDAIKDGRAIFLFRIFKRM